MSKLTNVKNEKPGRGVLGEKLRRHWMEIEIVEYLLYIHEYNVEQAVVIF